MIKFFMFFFQSSNLYQISVLILITLVHIAYMEKCINFLFLSLNLLHRFLSNLFILIYGVQLLLHLWMALNIMFFSLIILLDSLGFICCKENLRSLISLFISKILLKISSLPKLRPSGLMEVGNSHLPLSNLTYLIMVSYIRFHVHTLPIKMA